jgi:hypothetical protein
MRSVRSRSTRTEPDRHGDGTINAGHCVTVSMFPTVTTLVKDTGHGWRLPKAVVAEESTEGRGI